MNLNQMKRIASKSHHSKYCHSVLILDKDRVLSYGFNSNHKHAEVNAIRRLYRRNRIGIHYNLPKNLHLVSYMYKRKSGNPGNSQPCIQCMGVIRETRLFKTITYFQENKPCQIKLS